MVIALHSVLTIGETKRERQASTIRIYGKNGKNLFSGRAFYATNSDADIGSVKFLHTLFYKYLNHMLVKFERNRMS